jgi:hypothetical protein
MSIGKEISLLHVSVLSKIPVRMYLLQLLRSHSSVFPSASDSIKLLQIL